MSTPLLRHDSKLRFNGFIFTFLLMAKDSATNLMTHWASPVESPKPVWVTQIYLYPCAECCRQICKTLQGNVALFWTSAADFGEPDRCSQHTEAEAELPAGIARTELFPRA